MLNLIKMPCFRGLDISIGTDSGPIRLPEFPHPDSCSVTLVDPEPSASVLGPPDNSTLPLLKGMNIFRKKRVDPRISVYVPSLPGKRIHPPSIPRCSTFLFAKGWGGMRFWVQYSVLHVPSTGSHLYFKMFLNGKNVTNWGINLNQRTVGAVTRVLYKSDPEWCYINEGGHSIEARTLRFPPDQRFTSVARDEDCIEIQVFRASGRRRKVPEVNSNWPELSERGSVSLVSLSCSLFSPCEPLVS